MATKTINTRIGLKYDSYANWTAKGDWQDGVFTPSEQGASTYDAGFKPLQGEVVFYEIPSPKPAGAPVANPPAILFKVGDGTNFLKDLPWGSAIAADVYAWAKNESLLGGTESSGSWTWSQDAAYSQEQAEVAAFVKKETAAIKIRIVPTTPPTGHEGEDSWYDTEVSTDNGTTWIPSNTPFQVTIETYTAGNGLELNNNEFAVKTKQGGYITADRTGIDVTPAVVTYTPAHNTQYNFTSFGDSAGTTEYGNGVAELLGTEDGWTTVKVIENSVPGWANRTFKVQGTSVTQGNLYQLYENDTALDVWVRIDSTVPSEANDTLTSTTGVLTDGAVSQIKAYVDAKSAEQTSSGAVTVTETQTPTAGYAKTYSIAQGGTEVGKIDIPKDFLVQSATLETVETADVPYTGAVVGDKYIDFVINTEDASETPEHIYLPVKDLVDVYTGNWTSGTDAAGNTGLVKIEVDSNNVVSAHTYTGTLDGVHNEVYAFTSWSAATEGTQYGTGTAEKISSDSTSTTVKVTQNSVAGWTGRVFTVNATEVTTGQRYQLYENGSEIPVWVEIGTVTPATADALATVNDVKSYVDTHISQATPNIEGQEAIEVTASGNSKVVSLKLNDDAQNDQYSGLKQGNNGLEIDDDLTWYLQCGGAE